MILAEFNPMIFFLLLWGLFSWFTKKKKNQLKEKNQEEYSEIEPKVDLFTRLQKLQEHFSKEIDIFPSVSEPVEDEDVYFAENDEHSFEDPEILEKEPGYFHETEKYVFKTNIKTPKTGHNNHMKQILFRKSELRRLIVLKEVLGEPRSFKPYTGDYFQL